MDKFKKHQTPKKPTTPATEISDSKIKNQDSGQKIKAIPNL